MLGSLSPAQMVIKIVNEELVKLMGSETTEIALKPGNEITVIMMAGPRAQVRPPPPQSWRES